PIPFSRADILERNRFIFIINPEDASELIDKYNRNSMTNAGYLTPATLEYVFVIHSLVFSS
ncbi:hypothetical protein, partial [Bacillus thuringiensis]|uniref:hypothetical protein n=1 Tax=Bacillus thuringiensis TaxID=1428 RepID=UPI001C54EED7